MIPAGSSLDSVTVHLTVADVGEVGFAAEILADGVVECDTADNAVEWSDSFCP